MTAPLFTLDLNRYTDPATGESGFRASHQWAEFVLTDTGFSLGPEQTFATLADARSHYTRLMPVGWSANWRETADTARIDFFRMDAAPAVAETCGGCRFFDHVKGMKTGHCRRFPPVPVATYSNRGQTLHASISPEVWPSGWCGEWDSGVASPPVP